jgi:hypothetical protein
MFFSFIKYVFILWYIPFMLTIIQNCLNLYCTFNPCSVHTHIVLWINDVDVDRITNEIVAMVLATIDE